MQLLVPNQAMMFDHEGKRIVTVPYKWPVVREGHPILKGRGDSFSPIVVDFDTDEASEGASTSGAKRRSQGAKK